MAAKGKKKSKSKKGGKNAAKVKKVEEKKEEKVVEEAEEKEENDNNNNDNNDFDLETMEKMLAGNDDSDDDNDDEKMNNLDEDFMDNNDDESDDDNDKPNDAEESGSTEEESADEQTNQSMEEESEDEQEESKDELENTIEGAENCSLDLRNLLAINSHQLNHRSLYNNKKKKGNDDEEEITICAEGIKKANENYLLQKASEGCSQLLAGLWDLETEKSDAGPMAVLPTYFQIVTPRELPPPKQKAETKWEKFAKERGIAPKEKRSRKVWDEATGEWAYRTGLQKASSTNDPESWPIMEVKRNDNPFDDPWEKARDAKKERVEKNTMNRMRNAEKGGVLERGTTRRIMKSKVEAREKGREGGKKDMQNFATPAGVPSDMQKGTQRGKALTKLALMATQKSTASMGKFDKMREGEPERRKSNAGLKKRKFESATAENVVKAEKKKSLKLLENVINGGGKMKERAIRKGHFAKGETGHDYDFDDGLGSSSYKRKKGRAGMGKMKKITKKLAK